jgi:hypothetical protein
MIAFVIVEGALDIEILTRLVPPNLCSDIVITAGGGVDGVKSLARSLAASHRKPIAIVMDADTSDPQLVESRRQSMVELVRSAASSVPVTVIMAIPQLEVVFFEAPGPLDRLYPNNVANPLLFELARSNTRQALTSLDPSEALSTILRKLLDGVMDEDLAAFRQTPVIYELIQFLLGCQGKRVKIRLEIGPGIPYDLQRLKDENRWKALVQAFVNTLTSDQWQANGVATSTYGDTTVFVNPQTFNIRMEPPGSIPATFVVEVEGEARTVTHHAQE